MRLFELGCTVPWLMPEPAVQALLAVALREVEPGELARQMHGRPDALAFKDGVRRDDSRAMTVRDGVALIPIDGPIYRYADVFTEVSGGVTTEHLAKDLQRALDDPQVRAVLLVIDSPGGEATGINELSDAIYAARDRKPIWAYVEGYGASAAYWIASAASEIVVDDTALVGSIGTVFAVPDPAQRTSKTIEFVSSQSPHKRPNPTTEAGKATLQELVDGLTEVFIAKVARNRGVSPDTVRQDFGQGGMRIGQAAVDVGMADRLGSFEGTLAQLAQQAAAVTRPATPTPSRRAFSAGAITAEEIEAMDWRAFWAGMFGAAEASGATKQTTEQPAASEQPAADPAPAEQPAASTAAADPRIAELEAQLAARTAAEARQVAEQIEKDAQAFADGAVASRRAYPAEAEALAGLYRACAAQGETALGALRASVEARPQHSVTVESVPAAQQVLTADPSPKLDAKRRKELMSATPLGQAAMGREAKK